MGGGIFADRGDRVNINYNMFLSVNHPEWVYRYVKYVVPTLPCPDVANPFLLKHKDFLDRHNLLPEPLRK